MKNTNTTLRELSHQYANILRKCAIFNSIMLTVICLNTSVLAADYTFNTSKTVADNLTAFHNAITQDDYTYNATLTTAEGTHKYKINKTFAAEHPKYTRDALVQLLGGSEDSDKYLATATAMGDFIDLTGSILSQQTLGVDMATGTDGVKEAYKNTQYIKDASTMASADTILDSKINSIITGTENISYDNTTSGLASTTVKGAIDEIWGTANEVFAEKQQWVDKTLGVQSANRDAVKTALTGSIAGEETTITGAINVLDAQTKTNADAIKANTDAIGTTQDGAYVASSNTIGQNINALDTALGDVHSNIAAVQTNNNARFAQINNRIDKLEDTMEKGLAANNALAGLVPLDNSHKTQISAALGGYKDNQALAVGAFHYVNDKTLLNAGAAYGGNSSISYKVGVTFGF